MSHRIPLKNIYYLLSYAFGFIQNTSTSKMGQEDFDSTEDLLGTILAEGMARLIRRGLDRDYIERVEELRVIRGRIDLGESLRGARIKRGYVTCQYEELEYNVLQNRLLKAAAGRLLISRSLNGDVRKELVGVYRAFHDIDGTGLSLSDFRKVRIHRNNRHYAFLLGIARMVFEYQVVDDSTGATAFFDFRDDEARMGELFEAFIYNFYEAKQCRFHVCRPHIQWFDSDEIAPGHVYLPRMRTDLVLEESGYALIMDMKYYKDMLSSWHEKGKLRSSHLYQITSYLNNIRRRNPYREHEGMLLYPVVQREFRQDYRLEGHTVKIRTVNLDQEWIGIETDLLRLIS